MTVITKWSSELTTLSRVELLEKIRAQINERRFAHVLRVEEKALELAQDKNVNLEKVSLVALCHDYAKDRPDEEMIARIKAGDYDQEMLKFGSAIWHGDVGAELVSEELGINDAEILNAIRLHTVGASEMSLLDKIIYVADYTEAGRDFPGVEEARQIAAVDLDEAVSFATKHTLQHLIETNQKIYPKTLTTYNRWVAKL